VVLHRDGSVERAVEKTVLGGYAIAGQVCISVQRVFVQEEIFPEFLERLKERVRTLRVGDPMEEETDVGPMITREDTLRIRGWIEEAIQRGAKLETGGVACAERSALFEPTVVSLVPPETELFREEAFAPVVVVNPYREVEEALEMVNSSEYGLQLGVFTENLKESGGGRCPDKRGTHLQGRSPALRRLQKFRNWKGGTPKFAVEDYTEVKTVIFDLS